MQSETKYLKKNVCIYRKKGRGWAHGSRILQIVNHPSRGVQSVGDKNNSF